MERWYSGMALDWDTYEKVGHGAVLFLNSVTYIARRDSREWS